MKTRVVGNCANCGKPLVDKRRCCFCQKPVFVCLGCGLTHDFLVGEPVKKDHPLSCLFSDDDGAPMVVAHHHRFGDDDSPEYFVWKRHFKILLTTTLDSE